MSEWVADLSWYFAIISALLTLLAAASEKPLETWRTHVAEPLFRVVSEEGRMLTDVHSPRRWARVTVVTLFLFTSLAMTAAVTFGLASAIGRLDFFDVLDRAGNVPWYWELTALPAVLGITLLFGNALAAVVDWILSTIFGVHARVTALLASLDRRSLAVGAAISMLLNLFLSRFAAGA